MSSTDSLPDHLHDLDRECERVYHALAQHFDGDIDLNRASDNERGPARNTIRAATELVVQPGGSVAREVRRVMEMLCGQLKGAN